MRKGKTVRANHRTQDCKTKGQMMKTLYAKYRAEAAKMAAYRQTRTEIANMPRSVAMDLGIFPEDADQIARAAVWG